MKDAEQQYSFWQLPKRLYLLSKEIEGLQKDINALKQENIGIKKILEELQTEIEN